MDRKDNEGNPEESGEETDKENSLDKAKLDRVCGRPDGGKTVGKRGQEESDCV